jgi:RHS repeat-associated protein
MTGLRVRRLKGDAYYVRGRWYDPQAGRFVQEDPMAVDGGINVYTFAGNDPINGPDPSGMNPGDVCQELMMHSSGFQVWFGWQDTQRTECSVVSCVTTMNA